MEVTVDDNAAVVEKSEKVEELRADDLFNCSICYEPLEKAKILCCLHHFCQLCLERHYGLGMPKTKIKRFKVISCPNCREQTVMSRGIEGLPEDSSLVKMSWLLNVINSNLKNDGYDSETKESNMDDNGLKKELGSIQERIREKIMTIHTKMLKLAEVELNNLSETPFLPLGPKHKKARFAQIVKSDEYNPLLARLKRIQDVLYVANSNLKSFSLVADEAMSKLDSSVIPKILPKLVEIGSRILDEQSDRIDNCESVYLSVVPEFISETCSSASDYQNLRVKLKWRIGQRGTSPGMFQWPVDVAFASDRILVADKNNRRVQIFDFNGQFIKSLGENDLAPKRIAVDGEMYHVSDELGLCVKVFDNRRFKGNWGEGKFISPCGLSIDKEKDFIMSDAETGLVSVFNTTHYSPKTVFKTKSPADTSASNPYFIATNNDDQIIVSDSYNNCIKIFAKTGQLLLTFGRKLLACPRGVCLDKFGNILVVDSDHHKVRLFDGFGQFQKDLLTSTDGLNYPMGIDIQDTCLVVTQCGFYGGHELKMYALESD